MQYKCTIGRAAGQQYAVVCCDIDSYGVSLILYSYTVIRIYLATSLTREGHGFVLRK